MWASPASSPGRCLLTLPVLWASWTLRSHVSTVEPQPFHSAVLRSSSAQPELSWHRLPGGHRAHSTLLAELGWMYFVFICLDIKMFERFRNQTLLCEIYYGLLVSFKNLKDGIKQAKHSLVMYVHLTYTIIYKMLNRFQNIHALKCKLSSHVAKRCLKRNSFLCHEVIKVE